MLDKVSVQNYWKLAFGSKLRIFNMQISYLSWNNVADRTNVFFKFSRGVFNFSSISVVDSISVMSKYNMMQF